MAANWQGSSTYQRYLLDIVALYRRKPNLKIYLELLLSIITISILTLFAIKPTVLTIAELIVKINNQQQTSDQMDTKIKNLGTAQTLFNQEQANISLLNQAVPTGPDVPTYIRQIEGLLKKEGLTPTTLSVGAVDLLSQKEATAAATTSSQAAFTVTISGAYQQLLNLMQDLENLRRPALLNKLDFSISGANPETKTLTLTLSAQAPFNQ